MKLVKPRVSTELRQSLIEVLTGGNHLASVLVGRLNGQCIPSYKEPDPAKLQDVLGGDTWDLWIAWRAIMRLRDKMQELGVVE